MNGEDCGKKEEDEKPQTPPAPEPEAETEEPQPEGPQPEAPTDPAILSSLFLTISLLHPSVVIVV